MYRGANFSEKLMEVKNEQLHSSDAFLINDYLIYGSFPKSNVKYPHCGINMERYENDYDPYFRTESKHPSRKPSMDVGEPCMVNPSSYEALLEVMDHVKKTCSVGSDKERKWTILASDGVPYVLASEIQDNLKQCRCCGLEINTKHISEEDFEEFLQNHEKECNSDLRVKSRFMPLHNDLLLLLGPGHMELNEAGILLKLLWHPLISQLASMVGFRTPRAKDVVREGIDHHRTRQILSVCLEALSKELVLPFVHECIRNEEEVSVEGYQKYFKNVQNQSYIFFYDIAFSYLLSFHLLTEAIRKNNSRRILAARIQFAPLFYSFHHPKYQQLHLRDIWQRAQMPEPLLEFVNSNESFSLSGKNNTGQGCNFLHEELKKKVKSLLPPVMLTNEVWTRVCRKLKDLEEIRESTVKPTATTKAF